MLSYIGWKWLRNHLRSAKNSKFSWGGMPPDPPSRCVLCTHNLYWYFHICYQWPLHFLFASYTTAYVVKLSRSCEHCNNFLSSFWPPLPALNSMHGRHLACALIRTSHMLAAYNFTESLGARLEYELVDVNMSLPKHPQGQSKTLIPGVWLPAYLAHHHCIEGTCTLCQYTVPENLWIQKQTNV